MSRISEVVLYFFPQAELAPDKGRGWVKTLCPSHDETRPSATINHQLDAIKCFACGFSGDWIKIIMDQEGVTYHDALRLSEDILTGSYEKLPSTAERKPRRGLLTQSGSTASADRKVPSRLRRGTLGRA